MHACFPHPYDRLIIVQLCGTPERHDWQAIPRLIEARVRGIGGILLVLDVVKAKEAPGRSWKRAFLSSQISGQVERLSIVASEESREWSCELSALLSPGAWKCFRPGERKEALSWVLSGTGDHGC